jgi:hypothetical protein
MSGVNAAETEAWSVVQRLNEAWRTGRLEVLPALFHEHAVIVDATHQQLAIGREACVESYRAFVTSTSVRAYAEETPTVDVWGCTAVVSYPFRIRYTVGERSYDEAGNDCLVLTRDTSGWQVVWRQLVWRAI